MPDAVKKALEAMVTPKDHAAFDATALRMRSAPARDVLAWLASGGRSGLDGLMSIARQAVREQAQAVREWKSCSAPVAARLARLFAVQDIFASDLEDAHSIYQAIVQVHGPDAVPRRHVNIAMQVALSLGDHQAATALLPLLPKESYEHRFALLDLANPFVGGPHGSMERWLARLNQILWEHRVEAIGLASLEPTPFDGLASDVPAGTVEGPLVTVAVSSWRPDRSLLSAVASIVTQTWRNLEILLVDDGSPAEYDRVLAEAVALDPQRVRLLKQECNAGTYVARNRALAEAKGVYFTVHDSDDWAHPTRIERQVASLSKGAGLLGNYCTGLRAYENLLVSMPGVPPFRANESSLLFEREPVMARLGFYDASRKGADTEFSTRLRLVFGNAATEVLPDILTFIRLGNDSLSRAEFRPGWRHPARATYRRSFEAWHDRTSDLRIPAPGPHEAKFTRPMRFQIDRPDSLEFDIAYLSDFRVSALADDEMEDRLAVAAKAGRRVAIIQQDLFSHLSPVAVEPYSRLVQALIQERMVTEVDLGTEAHVGTLVVTHPELFNHATRLRASITADRVLLVDRERDSADRQSNNRTQCAQACKAIFAVDPQWVGGEGDPANGVGRSRAAAWPRAVWLDRWRSPAREPLQGRDPILGFELPGAGLADDWLKRMSGLGERRILAWVEGRDGRQDLPRSWLLHDRGFIPKSTYLSLVDFWIDLTPPGAAATPPTSVLQAMAAGCVPILEPSWRLQFGQAAVYAAPSDLARVVAKLAASPELRRRTLDRGPAFVEQHAGVAAFPKRASAN